MIITIARQYGSGGREIGELLAKRLGYRYYDREILTIAAEKSSIHPDVAKNFDLQGRIVVAELELDTIAELSNDDRRYVPIARTPAITRDMAVVVGEDVPVGDMIAALKRSGKGILEDVSVFDIYRGEHVEDGHKSVAFSLVYRAPDRTLTDDEAKKAFDRAVRSLCAQFGAKLRD